MIDLVTLTELPDMQQLRNTSQSQLLQQRNIPSRYPKFHDPRRVRAFLPLCLYSHTNLTLLQVTQPAPAAAANPSTAPNSKTRSTPRCVTPVLES